MKKFYPIMKLEDIQDSISKEKNVNQLQLHNRHIRRQHIDMKNKIIDKGIRNPLGKRLYTLKEAAEYLGRSDWSMRDLIWKRNIQVVQPAGARKIYLDIIDLDNFINNNKVLYS